MQKNITFPGIDSIDIVNSVNKKLQKIEQFISDEPDNRFIEMVFDVNKTDTDYFVEFHLKTHRYDLVVSHDGINMDKEIDHVIDAMYQALLKVEQEAKNQKKNDNFHKRG